MTSSRIRLLSVMGTPWDNMEETKAGYDAFMQMVDRVNNGEPEFFTHGLLLLM